MNIKELLTKPYARITDTHYLVQFILIINIFFFTETLASIIIQTVLIAVIWLHNKDTVILTNKLSIVEKRLREDASIFDRNIIVSESDLNGIITYVNPKFCEVTGYTKEELIGQPHSIMRDSKTPAEVYKKLWNTIKKGETFHGEFKNIKKDSSPFWIDSAISPIMINSKIIGYKAIRFDITEQTLAKEGLKHKIDEKDDLLKEQNARFEFVVNSSRDGFWDYDVTNQDFYLNSGWKKRLGFDENEKLTYLDYISLIPDEHRFEHHHAMHDMIDKFDGDLEYIHFRIRYPLITRNGEKIMIEDVGDAFFDKKETPTRITGFHRDITDQERQNKIIEAQNRMSEMGEMIGNIAHQWRQPISAINNVLNDVEFDIELEDIKEIDSKIFLETSAKVKDYTKYLSQTIDDFRNISSNEKVKTDFYIRGALDEAYKIVHKAYEKNSIRFQIIEFGEDSYEFTGFYRELLQVIINILNNAKDIIVEKEIKEPEVIITLAQKTNEVSIIIHDNAGGVPQAIIEKIFDPYFTTKHESVGTGIGLYMSKKMIIEHFNGTLIVENENNGAKFIITLPREE